MKNPLAAVRLVQVPAGHFLAVEGKGAPEGPAFGKATAALLRVAEAIRARHAAAGRDFPLGAPELLVWTHPAWQILLAVPDTVRAGELVAVRRSFHEAHREECRGVRLISLAEGACLEAPCDGHRAAEIAGVLAAKAGELGVTLIEPRHEIRRPGDELLVRQRVELPVAEQPRRHWRRTRSRGVPTSWKATV